MQVHVRLIALYTLLDLNRTRELRNTHTDTQTLVLFIRYDTIVLRKTVFIHISTYVCLLNTLLSMRSSFTYSSTHCPVDIFYRTWNVFLLLSSHVGTVLGTALVMPLLMTVAAAQAARLASNSTSTSTAVGPVVVPLWRTAACATTLSRPLVQPPTVIAVGSVSEKLRWTCVVCVSGEAASCEQQTAHWIGVVCVTVTVHHVLVVTVSLLVGKLLTLVVNAAEMIVGACRLHQPLHSLVQILAEQWCK